MGDLFHMGEAVGSGIGINDDAIELHSTWSSEKIDGEITLSKVYKMDISSFSSLPLTINNDYNIKPNMVVVNSVLSNPATQTSDWTVTPNSNGGSLTISGSISGSTALTLYLEESQSNAVVASVIKKDNAISVPSGITGVNLYKLANIYLFYITDASATNGVIGTLAVRPNTIISAPAYPQGVSYNCRLRIGTDGAVTVVPSNGSDPSVTTQNVMAMGFFIK